MSNMNTGRHVVYDLHAHIVLSTKRRGDIITERMADSLRSSCEKVCTRQDVVLESFASHGDHLHLLVAHPSKLALSRLVMSLKTISSHDVRKHGWPEVEQALHGDAFWSPSYCVVSTGGASLDVVKAYVENQWLSEHLARRAARDAERARRRQTEND